jgi:hypothetical protein
MNTPKTVKGYLKLLIQIANDSVYDLTGKGIKDEDERFISEIRANIQNELGEDRYGTMERNNLKYRG